MYVATHQNTRSLAVLVAGIASNWVAILVSFGNLPPLLCSCQNRSAVVSVTGSDRYCSSSWRVSVTFGIGETSAVDCGNRTHCEEFEFGSVRSTWWFGSVRVRLVKSLGSFGSVRNGLRMVFAFGVFGSGSVRFPSLMESVGSNLYPLTAC